MILAVVTPSYRNDWPLFKQLHSSVLAHTDDSVKHYVIVPKTDTVLFSGLKSPRCVVIAENDLYPRHFKSASLANRLLGLVPRIPSHARLAAINLKRPFRPIRGWIMQQALKMEACCRVDADVLLVLDSDVMLVRKITASMLCQNGRPRLYRAPGAVDKHLPQHVLWHSTSRKLLGLSAMTLPAPDYVSSFNVWDPNIVKALTRRLENTTGRHWMDAVTSQPSFSEWTLYGLFVDELMTDAIDIATDSSLCHSYWGTVPLAPEQAASFVADARPEDVAVLIQSKSRTPLAVRRQVSESFCQ
jgi:Family of unknown function (DUF6492)